MLALRLVGLVIPLGLDTFAVSAAIGMTEVTRRQRLKISVLFAVFEAGTPIVGLFLGVPLGHALGSVANYLAGGILVAYGLFSLLGSDKKSVASRLVNARGPGLLMLGLSVSLDELAIGFTLGLLHVPVIPVLVLIAAQTVVLSQLGMRLGAKLSQRFREDAERLASVVLTLLGMSIVVQRLLA